MGIIITQTTAAGVKGVFSIFSFCFYSLWVLTRVFLRNIREDEQVSHDKDQCVQTVLSLMLDFV